MAKTDKNRRLINLAAGWLCLATGALNWWNILGTSATFWRIGAASAITLIGLYLLIITYKSGKPAD